jgi:antirestriction protein ArdC
MAKKVNEILIDDMCRIIKEQNILPWQKAWREIDSPRNLITGKEYQGYNNVNLRFTSKFTSPYFASWKQIIARGGRVKTEEAKNPFRIVFYKTNQRIVQDKNGDDKLEKNWLMRYYRVYNVEQCEGLEYPKIEKIEHDPIECCEKVYSEMPMKPDIQTGNKAYYSPSFDYVSMPDKGLFNEIEQYYSTLFHELAHSTGHEKRLNRKQMNEFNNKKESYSFEELVAELTACFICGHCGIEKKTFENNVAYVDSWLTAFNKDPNMIIKASSQAQKAYDYILRRKKEEEANG